jgi:hypothetical protein
MAARPPHPDYQLYSAAQWGDIGKVRELLELDTININTQRDGGTPLGVAIKKGHGDIARLLIQKMADVNIPDTILGATPLHVAAETGQTDMVRLLIAKGANVEAADLYGTTPFGSAIATRNKDLAPIAAILAAANPAVAAGVVMNEENGFESDFVKIYNDTVREELARRAAAEDRPNKGGKRRRRMQRRGRKTVKARKSRKRKTMRRY